MDVDNLIQSFKLRMELYENNKINLALENSKAEPDRDKINELRIKGELLQKQLNELLKSGTVPQTYLDSVDIQKIDIESRIISDFTMLNYREQLGVLFKLSEINDRAGLRGAVFIVLDLGNHSLVVKNISNNLSKEKFKKEISKLENSLYTTYKIEKGELSGDGRFNVSFIQGKETDTEWAARSVDFAIAIIKGISDLRKNTPAYEQLYVRIGMHAGLVNWVDDIPSEKNIANITSNDANITGHLEKKSKELVEGDKSRVVISKTLYDMLPGYKKSLFTKASEKIDGVKCYIMAE